MPEIAAFPAFTGCVALFSAVAQVALAFYESEQAVKRGSAEKKQKNGCRKGYNLHRNRSSVLKHFKTSLFGDIKTFPVRTVENAVAPRNVFQKFLEGVP